MCICALVLWVVGDVHSEGGVTVGRSGGSEGAPVTASWGRWDGLGGARGDPPPVDGKNYVHPCPIGKYQILKGFPPPAAFISIPLLGNVSISKNSRLQQFSLVLPYRKISEFQNFPPPAVLISTVVI